MTRLAQQNYAPYDLLLGKGVCFEVGEIGGRAEGVDGPRCLRELGLGRLTRPAIRPPSFDYKCLAYSFSVYK